MGKRNKNEKKRNKNENKRNKTDNKRNKNENKSNKNENKRNRNENKRKKRKERNKNKKKASSAFVSLEDRLRAMQEKDAPASAPPPTTFAVANLPAPAKSLVSVLQQALQANDKVMFEYCLAMDDREVIQATVQRLPVAYVMPLLRGLINRVEKTPHRMEVLLVWIQQVFAEHARFLVTMVTLPQEIGVLARIIEERVAHNSEFGELSACLGARINRQAELREAEEPTEPVLEKRALFVYNEK